MAHFDVCVGSTSVRVDKVSDSTDLKQYAKDRCALFEREVSLWSLTETLKHFCYSKEWVEKTYSVW